MLHPQRGGLALSWRVSAFWGRLVSNCNYRTSYGFVSSYCFGIWQQSRADNKVEWEIGQNTTNTGVAPTLSIGGSEACTEVDIVPHQRVCFDRLFGGWGAFSTLPKL